MASESELVTGPGSGVERAASTVLREQAKTITDNADNAVQILDAELATLHAECLTEYAKHLEGLGGTTRAAALAERAGHFVLQGVDLRPGGLALVRRHFSERRKQRGNRTLLAERIYTHDL